MEPKLSLLTLTVAGTVLLILPNHYHQSPRSQGMGLAAISPALPPYSPLPEQNSSPQNNINQPSQFALSEETPSLTVVVDPAHGGTDFGARGPTGLAESDVVLDFARAVRISLEAQRLRVLLTREGNQDPSFDSRSAMTNGLRNAVFISLHVASGGPVGTARTYYYVFQPEVTPAVSPSTSAASPSQSPPAPETPAPQIATHTSMTEWDHAQRASVDLSRQLATLTQTELLRRFKGSPETPIAAQVRQLRTIVAPAIAIELSSIDVTDAKRLEQMAQPLAEAIGRAVAEFHYPLNTPAAASSGGH